MTNWPPPPPSFSSARPAAGPPGRLFNGTALALLMLAIWLSSARGGDPDVPVLVALCWLSVMLVWLLRFLFATSAPVVGPGARARTRWLVSPAMFVIAAWLTISSWALEMRLGLSEEPLDRAADAALAGFPPHGGWIGLYPVEVVTVDRGTVRFEVPGHGALVRDAPPVAHDPDVSYLAVRGRWSIEYSWEFVD